MQDFSNWTRADFQAFHAREAEVMPPTKEEIDARNALIRASRVSDVSKRLSEYRITFTGEETDFSELYRQYIKGEPDMKEWLGSDLDAQVAYRIAEGNSLEGFLSFVLTYEP